MDIIRTTLDNADFLYPYFTEKEGIFFDKPNTRFDMDDPENTIWWLAYDEDVFLGVCAAEFKEPHVWYLRSSLVPQEFRGQGIYRQLFDARMAYVLEQDPLLITVMSSTMNRAMYHKLGFKGISDFPHYEEVFLYKNV